MKKTFAGTFLAFTLLVLLAACNNASQPAAAAGTQDSSAVKDTTPVTAQWKIGVQLWTFHEFPFVTAIAKADSAGAKYIEAFPGQPMGGDFKDTFGIRLSAVNRSRVKALLASKGITMMAFGVVGARDLQEWKAYFELGRDMGISYMTAEPTVAQWNYVDSLAGIYGIKVAIHDHPRPSHYWHPDSVLAATQGHPHLGSCADLGHWSRNGLDDVECLKKLEGHVFGVHFKDVKTFGKVDAEDVITGTGVNKFPEIFAELKRQGFTGMFSIERENNWQNNVPDVIAEIKYFNEQVAKLK